MTETSATLLAAVIAAVAAVLGVGVTLITTTAAELRTAHRHITLPLLSRIGQGVHEVVALSHAMLKAANEDTFQKRRVRATTAAERLKKLRRRSRYALWGLEKGIRELTRVPDWLSHTRGYPESAKRLHDSAARLGERLDTAIMRSYRLGRPPSRWDRWRVSRAQKRVRSAYDTFMATPKEQRR